MNTTKNRSVQTRGMTASKFEALPDAQKERIYQEIERKGPERLLAESKPLTWQRSNRDGTKSRKDLGAGRGLAKMAHRSSRSRSKRGC